MSDLNIIETARMRMVEVQEDEMNAVEELIADMHDRDFLRAILGLDGRPIIAADRRRQAAANRKKREKRAKQEQAA